MQSLRKTSSLATAILGRGRLCPSFGSPVLTVFCRSKHSNRQVKRLMTRHPARLRVAQRLGQIPAELPPPKAHYPPVVENVTVLENGWTPPPPEDLERPEYPFVVARTRNKPKDAVGFLPVYAKMRKDGTLTTTRIKKVKGDRDAFCRELRAALELPEENRKKNAGGSHNDLTYVSHDKLIRVRNGGTIEVKGNYVRMVKRWLAGLGF